LTTEDVRQAMRGDHDAFAALIGAASTKLYALACLILRDSDRAEDATQDAFIRAWREVPRLRDADKFDAWLRRLVVNSCYDEARRSKRRAEVTLFSVIDRTVVDTSAALGETDRIERAFRQLPLDQRSVLVLQHYFSLSHVEIAETLALPLGTVKSRVRYGIAAMRSALEAGDRAATQAGRRSA
jgi:RNA polymerase sigma-70 factor (ECF subfamily)